MVLIICLDTTIRSDLLLEKYKWHKYNDRFINFKDTITEKYWVAAFYDLMMTSDFYSGSAINNKIKIKFNSNEITEFCIVMLNILYKKNKKLFIKTGDEYNLKYKYTKVSGLEGIRIFVKEYITMTNYHENYEYKGKEMLMYRNDITYPAIYCMRLLDMKIQYFPSEFSYEMTHAIIDISNL